MDAGTLWRDDEPDAQNRTSRQGKDKTVREKDAALSFKPGRAGTAILAAQKRHYKARVRLLEAFRDNLDIPMEFARREFYRALAAIRPMEERGQLSVKVSVRNAG